MGFLWLVILQYVNLIFCATFRPCFNLGLCYIEFTAKIAGKKVSPAQWSMFLLRRKPFLFCQKYMLQKSKKEEMIKELEGVIKKSESLVFVNFHGLKVSDETILRRDLRKEGVGYKVSRKTLLARALKGKAEGEVPELAGEVAIAYLPTKALATEGSKPTSPVGRDATTTPREIYNFQKTHKGIINILGGIFEGKFIDGVKMIELAMIPSREVLLSKLAFLLKSPIQRLAIAVGEVAKKK